MQHLQTEVLVIGGGATGTGILRDLAMRGFKCLLVDRRDLAYGTTGRYHGLLHSGGRYVVKDPQAARECYEENKILRRIMPQCIEDTGGFFVLTSHDDPAYIPQFLDGCHKAGITVESVSISHMLKEEPLLDPSIKDCFRVPDASADSFLAADLNAESARQYGAQVFTYHEVVRLELNRHSLSGSPVVSGALCHDLAKDEDIQIDASMVINASGAWAGNIASSAGINLVMVPGKGTMLALNHRIVNTVINRCKPPSDGDILVPTHTVSVIGTTDIQVNDPDHYSIEPWEIHLMLEEGEKIIPRFKQFRILRAWAGVRPLIQEKITDSDRDISRAFILLDHTERDGIDGIVTITSGKWTTYRKMAEVTVNKVCEKLQVDRQCRTHLEVLPALQEKDTIRHYLGARLEKIEKESNYGQLICECELATRQDVEQAIIQSSSMTLDDIRRDSRLGMGPCQGAFCTLRAAGILHAFRHPSVQETNVSLRDFLQERWKGNVPILWGQQLRQERFNELIYIDVLNAPNLPGRKSSILAAENYTKPIDTNKHNLPSLSQPEINPKKVDHSSSQDVIVIGAGLSGLITGWRSCLRGFETKIITKGWGVPYWSTGCIDLFGYQPPDYSQIISSPHVYLEEFLTSNPNHPYALVGLDVLEQAVHSFLYLCEDYGYPFRGSIDTNLLLPTSLGTLRPTCLVPMTMIAGDAHRKSPMLIVGFDQFLDFHPALIADNLNAQDIVARDITLDLKTLHNQKFLSGMVLARLFDNPEFRQELVDALKSKLGNVGRVGFPAVLGLQHPMEVLKHLESSLGLPVFEISGLPPSIPGIRLHNLLVSAIQRNHGSIYNGMSVSKANLDNKTIQSIWSEAAVRQISHQAKTYVLATGGILGGGITTYESGFAQENIFGIPIIPPDGRLNWFNNEFLSNESHPIHRIGLAVDSTFHLIDKTNAVLFRNLYAVGSSIENCDPVRERSLEGIALTTGYKVGESLSISDQL